MKKHIVLTLGIICMGFQTLTILDSSISGDFDGNGTQEKAWIKTDFAGQQGNGESEEYIPARRSLLFENNKYAEINIENASEVFNIGDINSNQTDEILISGSHGLDPFYHPYSVYTLDTIQKSWLKVLDANAPTRKHEAPKNWVFNKNDTLFYWSSILTDFTPTLKDTLRWVKK